MLVNLAELFKDAKKGNYAVGAFNTPTFEAVRAVIAAAEEMNCPVILDHAEGHEWSTKIEDIGPVMLDYARKAKVPVCCHLDHGVSPSMLWRAVRVGFPSVMYDCSAMPYEENIANVKEFVTFAHKMGMTVEAELGKMPNKEAGTLDADGNVVDYKPEDLYTDPSEAARFCEETQCDALAISFGTVHGFYRTKPKLDTNVVAKVQEVIPENVGLVMHGGSGVSPEGFQSAISNGIRKINYYTYMATAPSPHIADYIKNADDLVGFQIISNLGLKYMQENAMEAMKVFMNR